MLITVIMISSLTISTITVDAANYQLNRVLQPNEPRYSGYFGYAITISEDTIIVGEEGAARAYIYTRSGDLIKILESPAGPDDSLFGRSVAIISEHIIVGDPYAPVRNLTHAGAIYVYNLTGSPQLTVESPNPQENGGFGFSLSTDNQRLAVGEPAVFGFDANVTARVHVFDGVSDTLPRSFDEPPLSSGYFGWSVALRGDTLAVGEPYTWYSSPSPGGTRGLLHLYSLNSTGNSLTLKSPIGVGFGNFGFAVSIGEDVIAVGEVRGNANSTEMAGTVHLYTRGGEHLRTLYPQKPLIYGYFGVSLSVSERYILVNQKGSVYFYDHRGNLLFNISQGLTTGAFGNDCVVDGELFAAGAYEFVDGVEGAGRVYLYRLFTPPDIQVKRLGLSSGKVSPGEVVEVTVELVNLGEAAGNFTIVVRLDGVDVGSIPVWVEGNSTKSGTLTISSGDVGLHQVSVEDQSLSLEVVKQGIPSYISVSIVLGILISVILLVKNRAHEER